MQKNGSVEYLLSGIRTTDFAQQGVMFSDGGWRDAALTGQWCCNSFFFLIFFLILRCTKKQTVTPALSQGFSCLTWPRWRLSSAWCRAPARSSGLPRVALQQQQVPVILQPTIGIKDAAVDVAFEFSFTPFLSWNHQAPVWTLTAWKWTTAEQHWQSAGYQEKKKPKKGLRMDSRLQQPLSFFCCVLYKRIPET